MSRGDQTVIARVGRRAHARRWVAGVAGVAVLAGLATGPAQAVDDTGSVATSDAGVPLGPVAAPAVGADTVLGTKDPAAIPAVPAAGTARSGDAVPADTNWGATSLGPSAAWAVSAQTGTFTWSYPFAVPPSAGGAAPDLALSYSSATVDGRVASSNTQTSWVGEGWDLSAGFIERSFVPCFQSDTNTTGADETGDLCWAGDNATISFAGGAGPLVKDVVDGSWHLQADDGTKIEHLTGGFNASAAKDYWRVTSPDGTQYVFGRGQRSATDTTPTNAAWTAPVFGNDPGEPCYSASGFAASWCETVWRWNLEYVIDTSLNTTTYFYATETNKYGRNKNTAVSSYVRGGYLSSIEYGQRQGTEATSPAPARVVFTVADRCLDGQCTTQTAQHWPDVPLDLVCTSTTTCPVTYPAFFTRKRLTEVRTEVRGGAAPYATSGFSTVDRWTLAHEFADPYDNSTAYPNILWLTSVTHVGDGGPGRPDVALAQVVFGHGDAQAGRAFDQVGDGRSPMRRYRLTSITNESGGTISVTYASTCTQVPTSPDVNTSTCIPVRWTPEGSTSPILEYFHKYLVTAVVANGGGDSPATVTSYAYSGGAAWHYDTTALLPTAERTWNQFRGYATVEVSTGTGASTPLRTGYRYFRGMHGDKTATGTRTVSVDGIADQDILAGTVREQITYDASTVVARTVSEPWLSAPTATDAAGMVARRVGTASVATTVYGSQLPGGSRTTKTETTFDALGMPSTVQDLGDDADDTDDRCTTIEYTRNTAANIVTTVKRVETVSTGCAGPVARPADVISDVRTRYDGLGYGAAPTKGLVTATGAVPSYTGATADDPNWALTTYDVRGRVASTTDALGRTTTVAYTTTDATSTTGQVVATTTTSPDPDGGGPLTAHTVTTVIDPGWGTPTAVTDARGITTTVTLDALGRVTAVSRPGAAIGDHPAVTYAYSTDLTAVTTSTLTANGGTRTQVAIADALGRPRQTQTVSAKAEDAGARRVITDTVYDDRGLVAYTNDGWLADGAPGTAIVVPTIAVPARTVYAYDGAGRTVQVATQVNEATVWSTSTVYDGDRVTLTPPAGGTPTTTITNARGQTTELRRYTTGVPSGAYQLVTYGYDHAGRLAKVHDAAGNQWTYTHDLLGRQTGALDPDKGATATTYDVANQVVTTTDANAKTLGFAYDNLGRVVGRYQLTSPTQAITTGTKLAGWVYDTVGKGLLTSSTRYEAGGKAYTTSVGSYDDAGRPLSQTVTLPSGLATGLGTTYTTSYTYAWDGQLSTVSLPAVGATGAETVRYYYDDANVPEWMGSGRGWGTYVQDSAWSAYGQLLQTRLGTTWAYFVTNSYEQGTRRLAGTTLERQTATGLATDVNLAYAYDAFGNPVQVTDTAGGTDRQCFTYDGLGRLASAWTAAGGACTAPSGWASVGGPAPYWQDYTYTASGDRKTLVAHTAAGVSTSTYTYQDTAGGPVHGVTAVTSTGAAPGTAAFAYDATGNTTHRTVDGHTQTLGWDAEGHLATVDDDTAIGAEGRYVYTADGDRLVRTQNGATTVYLPGGQEITATGGQLSVQRSYAFAGQVVAVRTGPGNDQVWSMVSDPHHSATVAINNAATPGDPTGVVKRRMDPFGNPRGTTTTWPTDKGLMNKPVDASGLTQVGARYYDPVFGRFITVDPIMNLADPNQWAAYAYANNNPVTNWDPDGLLVAGDFETLGQAQKRQQQATKISTRSSRAGGGTSGQPSRSSGSPEIEFNPNADIERQIAMGTLYQEGLASELETRREQTCQDRISAGLAPCGTPEAREEGAWMLAGAAGGIAGELVIGGLVARIALVRGSAVASAAETGVAQAGPAEAAAALRARLAQQAGFGGSGPRIIVDENLPSSWAQGLRSAGYDARSIAEMEIQGASDVQINQLAEQVGARVLTRDVGHQLDGGFGSSAITIDSRVRSLDSVLRLIGGG